MHVCFLNSLMLILKVEQSVNLRVKVTKKLQLADLIPNFYNPQDYGLLFLKDWYFFASSTRAPSFSRRYRCETPGSENKSPSIELCLFHYIHYSIIGSIIGCSVTWVHAEQQIQTVSQNLREGLLLCKQRASTTARSREIFIQFINDWLKDP